MVRVIIVLVIIGSICVVLFTTAMKNFASQDDDLGRERADTTAVKMPAYTPVETIDKLLPLDSSREGDQPFTHVMIHFASDALRNPENPHNVQAVYDAFVEYAVGAHYYIARDGTVYRFIEETRKAHHAGKGMLAEFSEVTNNMNEFSIGVELAAVGSAEEMKGFFGMDEATYARIPVSDRGYTAQQYVSLALLLDDVTRRHGIPLDRRHIVGHDEYAPDAKTDPGELFDWSRIGL